MSRAIGTPRILVCEADDSLQAAFRLMLEEWASVRVVAEVTECFKVLAHDEMSLLILDLDGQIGRPLHCLRRLRLVAPDLTMLLVAGAFSFDFQVAALKYSPVRFLTKPFPAKATVRRIQVLTGFARSSIRTRVIRIAAPQPVADNVAESFEPLMPGSSTRTDDLHFPHAADPRWRDAVGRLPS